MRSLTRSFVFAIAAGVSGIAAQAALADCGGAIRFAPGTSQGSVSGSIKGDGLCEYTLAARKGQVMTVTLDAGNGMEAIVFDPVSHNFIAEPSLTLPQNGTYTLRVLQTRNAARQNAKPRPFTMTVQVGGKAAAAATPATPAPSAKGAATSAAAATRCETTQALTADIGNYSGAIKGDGLCEYTFTGRAGQKLGLLMDAAPEIDAIIYAPVSATLERDGSFTLPQDGTYTVRVLQNRNAARNSSAAKPFSMVLNLD